MKRFLSALLTLCLVLTLLPATALAVAPKSGKCGSSVTYELDTQGSLTISGSGDMYYSVQDFQYSRDIERVTIEYGVTSIASELFRGCTNLRRADIASSVKRIGASAFRGCTSLYQITIPERVTSLGASAFQGCTKLERVEISGKLTSLEDSTFYACSSLKSVTLPETVTSIPESVFQFCDNLSTIHYGGTRSQWDRCVANGDIVVPSGVSVYCSSVWITGGVVTLDEDSFVYDGTEKRPGVTVELQDKTLRKGTDYTVEYENNVDVGTATVTVTGKGDYSGTIKKEFRIERADPGLRFEKDTVTFSSLDDVLENPLTADSDGAVSYRSSNPDAVEVDAATGEITLHAGQNATITASMSPTKNYTYGTASYEVISALGHRYEVRGVKEPACTEPGYTGDEVCIDCGEIGERGREIPAKGHIWGEWKTTKQATASEPGTEQRVCAVCGEKDTRTFTYGPNPFIDVPQSEYYYDPVMWAVNHRPQITNGMSATTFEPDKTCTRGQVVTFLWRAKGCPEPTSERNPFVDVQRGDYFFKAVLWAAELGITKGADETHFDPEGACTRAHVVTFLWRANGCHPRSAINPFVDVPSGEYYTDAVLWAVAKGITKGTSDTAFSPYSPCTRGQIVTFLQRSAYAGTDFTKADLSDLMRYSNKIEEALDNALDAANKTTRGADGLSQARLSQNYLHLASGYVKAILEIVDDYEDIAQLTDQDVTYHDYLVNAYNELEASQSLVISDGVNRSELASALREYVMQGTISNTGIARYNYRISQIL